MLCYVIVIAIPFSGGPEVSRFNLKVAETNRKVHV